jgi:hypothetical protein
MPDYEIEVSLKTFLDVMEEKQFDSMRCYIGTAITKGAKD